MYRQLCLICVLCICILCACTSKGEKEQASAEHQHVPDNANCQSAQCCVICGEQLAEQGEHDYPSTPYEQIDGYSFYTCRICGQSKIINEDGLPVVPVE